MQNISVMSLAKPAPCGSSGSDNTAKVMKQSHADSSFQKYMDQKSSKTDNRSTANQITGQEKKIFQTNDADSLKRSGASQQVTDNSVDNGSPIDSDVIDTVASAVVRAIKDVTGIDEETMENLMTSMGITPLDLLNPAVLQQFTMELAGQTDPMVMLTDENLMQTMQSLQEGLQSIDWEGLTGMTGEEFLNRLQQFMDLQSDVSAEGVDILSDTEENVHTTTVQQEVVHDQYVATDEVDETGTSQDVTVSGGQAENASQGQSQSQSDSDTTWDQNSLPVDTRQSVPVEQTIVSVNDFAASLVQAAQESSGDEMQPVTNMQQMIDIVNQVVDKIHTTMQDDMTTMEMQLNPERLGSVLLNVSSKNGVMTASFYVQTQEAKEALESQMMVLRENLEQKNLKVEAVEVSVSDFDFSHSNQSDTQDQKDLNHGNGRAHRMKFDTDDEENDSATSEDSASESLISGGNVDYIA